ncbi:gasdermin-E-like isoform X2 [Coregonus clupeaformis]|uniref:gasdermin-E-like isoform X2 n=1 Tax=Coregonus clupeaformis TaxID=59861 RepID=UPI001BE126D0|nr:gasdermin-E-like isoform X2 [Coregonus clupeaformis]
MISKAVKSMLKEVDYNGSLIPVSSLNDSSGKLNLLSLIVKTRPRLGCFWQEPKYQSRGFTLSDVLKPGKLEEPKDKPFNPELCLFSNNGGFEKVYEFEEDGIMDLVCDFDANSPLNLKKELEKLSSHFQLLSALPAAKRSSLLQLLKTTMEDGEAVSVLESVLDRTCDGETPDLGDLEESERETVQAILDLVDQCVGKDEIRSSLLTAIHLIVSAMDGMTDEGLSVLGSCCSPPVLQALQILVQHVAAGSGETLSLRDAGLAVLTEEEVFGRTESLFGHSKVTLKREEDTLRTEMKDQPGYLPLVMSITVKGLASLV